MKNNVPYFNNVYDWVNSLPYGKPLTEHNGRDCGGYVYDNPFNARFGERPGVVYDRLFCRDHYYNLTDEELTKLRTTIQYLPIYLDTALVNNIKFLESCGFKVYRKEGKPGSLMHVYLKRNNVSLYISNQTTPQDYRPNKINISVGELIKKSNWKNQRRVEINSSCYDYGFDMPDEFGELTKKELEKYIKERMVEKIMNKITFKDIAEKYIEPYKDGKGNDINHITITMYDVNKTSGELKIYKPNTLRFYLHPYNGQFFCQIGNPWINGIHYIVDYGEEDNNSAKGCIASNHILFLDKEDAKKYSIDIFTRMRDKLNAKIEKVKKL